MRTTPNPSSRSRRSRGQEGVAIFMTALLLIPLMVFAAYGVDLASWYSRISYLQKAADAAALAGTVWMPELTTAQSVACETLLRNGIDCANTTDNIEVSIAVGSTINSLRVEITDTNAKRYFSGVIGHHQTLVRGAEAEYNLAIPLGSPLNYFGGDATRTVQPSVTNHTITWPQPYGNTSWPPAPGQTYNCNVGSSSAQGFGGWRSATDYRSGDYGSSSPRCTWAVRGQTAAGTTNTPPPDYPYRAPNNAPCNVFHGTTTNGRWETATTFNAGARYTSGTGFRQCTWNNYITDASTVPPFYNGSNIPPGSPPTNRPCRVGYETSLGWWGPTSTSGYSTSSVPSGGLATAGNRLCTWMSDATSTTTTPPNPIASDRSPGFWAMIEGPASVAPNGDIYNTRCYINNACSSVQNLEYKQPTNADRGFWYVVQVPNVALGSIDISVFDASYNPSGSTLSNAGDRNIGDTNVFPTEFRVYRQNNTFDFTDRTPVTMSAANQTEGSCYWSLGSQAAFQAAWKNLCTITAPTPGATYLVQVQTTGTSGNGINGYAIQAVSNGGLGTQPALYAYKNMGMQNNNDGSPPPPATFYLAEVGPQYAGKTLVIDLWDPGDASGNASIYPKAPSKTAPRPVSDVPASSCSYRSSPAPNPVQTNSDGGATGSVYTSDRPSDYGTRCGIRTTISGTRQFNGSWLSIRIAIPSDYTCTLNTPTNPVNPETDVDSCWWGIEYNFSAAANDVTTWAARIEGNPVHLTH
jgi:Flp pilus assembly protein TadG